MITTGDDIFQVIDTENSSGQISVKVSVNKNSEILKGHFPGQPVVPGACVLQLVKDVLENTLGDTLLLKKAGNIKFSKMVVPKDDQVLSLAIIYKTVDDLIISVNAKISEGDVICFKLQGNYAKI